MERKIKNSNQATRRLRAELDGVVERLHTQAKVPGAGATGGDFFDVAQTVELQEIARLSASRLAERARRLQTALTRVSAGQYGVCSDCGAVIPPKRLLAIPDVTTCVACQEQLERVEAAAR